MFKFFRSLISTPFESFGVSNRVERDAGGDSQSGLGIWPCFVHKLVRISTLEGCLMEAEKEGVLPPLEKVPPCAPSRFSPFLEVQWG